MTDPAPFSAGLPFKVDDANAANDAFARGRAGDPAARRLADIWAYTYVLRYMARAFARERFGDASDVDAVEDRVLRNLPRVWERVDSPDKFAHYVMKMCKNALLTHRARRKTTVEADDTTLPPDVDDERHAHDAVVVRRDVAAAIAELPDAVRVVAEMKVLGGMSFEEIAHATGHPLPTIRTYASKANARLREHPTLRAHAFDDVLPPSAVPSALFSARG